MRPHDQVDVQATLDQWLIDTPPVQPYITTLYYVPDGAPIPEGVTHMARLTAVDRPDLELRVGVVATAETTAVANVLLGLIGRSAADPKAHPVTGPPIASGDRKVESTT